MTAGPPLIAGLACAALSACMATPPPLRTVQADGVAVTSRDRVFVASIQPGAAGTVLTRAGAVSIAGATVRVTARGLARDEGLAAKEAARLACEGQGGAFQGQAIGRYAGPETWAFAGACA